MTWRITASFHESTFGDSDMNIECILRDQFRRCTRSPQHLPGILAAEKILVAMAIALARSVRGMPGQNAAISRATFQLAADGCGGLIHGISILPIAGSCAEGALAGDSSCDRSGGGESP